MIPPTDWTPTPADIAWQRNMLRVLQADKPTSWAVPCSASVFQIDKKNRTFRLKLGNPDDETNKRIAVVFIHLGYKEVEGNPADSTPPVNRVKEFFDNNED